MEELKKIKLPLDKGIIKYLEIGDKVFLSGDMLVMRDAAHGKIREMINAGLELPVNVENECI